MFDEEKKKQVIERLREDRARSAAKEAGEEAEPEARSEPEMSDDPVALLPVALPTEPEQPVPVERPNDRERPTVSEVPPHKRVAALFEAAWSLSSVERAELLAKEPDPAVRRRVEKLIRQDRADGQARGVLDRQIQSPLRPGSEQEPQPGELAIGTIIHNYQITRRLGEGGMGVVYKAQHRTLETYAAVKILKPAAATRDWAGQRFISEAQAAARVHHPGIVSVFDVGELPGGQLYILMEYLEGETLARRLKGRRPMPPEIVRVFADQVLNALAVVHARGIVHRDLKPANIYLVKDPDLDHGERVKLLDFGLAKLTERPSELQTMSGIVMGTPGYMAPEQWQALRTIDHRADIYSLGIILYEMLCGRRPFSGDELYAQVDQPPISLIERNPAVPPDLDAIVMRMLAKDRAARFQSAQELRDALQSMSATGARLFVDSKLPTEPMAQEPPQIPRPARAITTGPRGRPASQLNARAVRLPGLPETISLRNPAVYRTDAPATRGTENAAPGDPVTNESATMGVLEKLPTPIRRTMHRAVALVCLLSLVATGLAWFWSASVPREMQPIDRLILEFRESDERIRLIIIDAVWLFGEPLLLPILLEALDRGTNLEQNRAIDAVCELGWSEAVPHLEYALGQTPGPRGVDIAACLLDMGRSDVSEQLQKTLDDIDSPKRLRAAEALARAQHWERVTEPLKSIIANSSRPCSRDWRIAQGAFLHASGVERDNAHAALVSCMDRSGERERFEVAKILAEREFPEGIERLQQVAGIRSHRYRWDAALVLARLGHTLGLERVVEDGLMAARPDIRAKAMAIAARSSDPSDERLIAEFDRLSVAEREPTVRFSALTALISLQRRSWIGETDERIHR